MLDLKNRVRVQADFVELYLLDPQTYFPTAVDLPEIGYDEDETMRFFVGVSLLLEALIAPNLA